MGKRGPKPARQQQANRRLSIAMTDKEYQHLLRALEIETGEASGTATFWRAKLLEMAEAIIFKSTGDAKLQTFEVTDEKSPRPK